MTLPCETTVVPKLQITRTLQTLRAEGHVVPVLIGLDADVERLAECHIHRSQSVPQILADADTIDVAAFFAAREERWRHRHRLEVEGILRHAAETPGSFCDEAGQQIVADYKRMLAENDFRVSDRADVLGHWPLKPRTSPDLTKELGNWSFSAWPEMAEVVAAAASHVIALMPVKEDAHAFAHFCVGGWDDSPLPAEHVAVFRYWAATYDIELFQLDDHRCLMTVGAPPETEVEARELAWQQFFYSPQILDHGPLSVSDLAARLLHGRSWGFWWE